MERFKQFFDDLAQVVKEAGEYPKLIEQVKAKDAKIAEQEKAIKKLEKKNAKLEAAKKDFDANFAVKEEEPQPATPS